MQKVSILVDVQNIYYTTKQVYRRGFDYNAFWQQATKNRAVVHAFAYASEPNDDKQKQFQNILRAIGFQVKLKPFIQREDGSAKCDWDVGITIDALDCIADSDVIVLATGDGDFDRLAQKIRQGGNTEVEVFGVPKLTAASLIKSATRFIPITEGLVLTAR